MIRVSCWRRRQVRLRLAPSLSAPAPTNARIARRALPPCPAMSSPSTSRVTAPRRRCRGAADGRVLFSADLGGTVAWGDERYAQIMELVRKTVRGTGLTMPAIPSPAPFDDRAPEALDLAGFGAIIFAGGFRPDYRQWVRIPEAFDELGFPLHREGASLAAPGLYFVGVHFLRKRKSSLLFGVGEDAAIVARSIGERQPAPRR